MNDETLLGIAKEQMKGYAEMDSVAGLMLGNVYHSKVSAIYELLVKIYGEPYLEEHGIKMIVLEDENEQLRKENKVLEEDVEDYHNALFDLHKKYDKLEKENEQLRQEIVHLKDDLQYYKTKSARLEEELLSTRGCMYE